MITITPTTFCATCANTIYTLYTCKNSCFLCQECVIKSTTMYKNTYNRVICCPSCARPGPLQKIVDYRQLLLCETTLTSPTKEIINVHTQQCLQCLQNEIKYWKSLANGNILTQTKQEVKIEELKAQQDICAQRMNKWYVELTQLRHTISLYYMQYGYINDDSDPEENKRRCVAATNIIIIRRIMIFYGILLIIHALPMNLVYM